MPGNPFLVVGLGNPGAQYENTRHNIGFEIIDALAARWRASAYQNKFHAEIMQLTEVPGVASGKVILMKPLTYMNRSGLAVGEAMSFFKLDPANDVLVISDDLDLPPGQLRLRLSGGAGGHNGLKSIIQALGTESFPRLRIGIGRAPNLPADVYVLAKIPKAERVLYDEAQVLGAESVERCLKEGTAQAMNSVNQKRQIHGP
jgi:PTH1 family peptidyl-tRNA hydrolase